ncbi:hypothetical protein GCM10010276_20910 [Streptomyces longisporus]|uniref:Uncharacterized protein n=1 Tax=Streptomyces longisporus TaxID=1948 RepID=A0ABN3LJ46_STRLO
MPPSSGSEVGGGPEDPAELSHVVPIAIGRLMPLVEGDLLREPDGPPVEALGETMLGEVLPPVCSASQHDWLALGSATTHRRARRHEQWLQLRVQGRQFPGVADR